jgi:hypothetical protein
MLCVTLSITKEGFEQMEGQILCALHLQLPRAELGRAVRFCVESGSFMSGSPLNAALILQVSAAHMLLGAGDSLPHKGAD